jgi:hypothetical protein
LRASEVARLRACDIDSEQMIIRVVQSKGRKDRNVMLPAEILDLLRQWWKARPTRRDAGVAREQRWLFPGRTGHLTTRQFGRLFKEAAKAAKLDTTARYTRVATGIIAKIESPLARLSPPRHRPAKRDAEKPPALSRRRSWFGRFWRSRTSSASTVPLGARPTAAMRASIS